MVVLDDAINLLDVLRNMFGEYELGSTQFTGEIFHPSGDALSDPSFEVVG